MDDIVVDDDLVITGNASFVSSFRTVAALAGVYCVLALVNAFQLSMCLDLFCDNDAAELRSQRFAQRLHKFGYQYAGVNTLDDDDLDDDL